MNTNDFPNSNDFLSSSFWFIILYLYIFSDYFFLSLRVLNQNSKMITAFFFFFFYFFFFFFLLELIHFGDILLLFVDCKFIKNITIKRSQPLCVQLMFTCFKPQITVFSSTENTPLKLEKK